MILIIGASGNVGQQLVTTLKRASAEFAVLNYDSATPNGVASVKGDTAKPQSLDIAMAEVDKVFLLSPYSPELVKNERNVVDAAVRAGVRHLVKHSAFGADPDAVSTVLRWHGESEAYVRASGVPFDIIRPNSFMQNIPAFFGPAIRNGDGIAVAAGEGQVSFIDVADLAEIYAQILTHPSGGRILNATGPEALSYREVAELLTLLLDKPIPYRPLSQDASLKALAAADFPDWMAMGFTDYFEFQAGGGCRDVHDAALTLTGRPSNTMQQFLAANLAALEAQAQDPLMRCA